MSFKIKTLRIVILYVFLVAQFFSITRMFYLHFWGNEKMIVFTSISFGSLILLPLLIWLYTRKTKIKDYTSSTIFIIKVFLVLIIFYFLLGLLVVKNPLNFIGFDISTILLIFSFFIIGTNTEFWDDLIGPAFLIHLVALGLNIWASFIIVNEDLYQRLLDSDINNRVAVLFLSYQTQFALYFWTFLMLMYKKLSKFQITVLIFSVVFIIIQQILFQKRAPTFRIISYLFIFLLLLNSFSLRKYKKTLLKYLSLALFLIISGLTVFLVKYQDSFIINQFVGLTKRFNDPAYGTKKIGFLSFERFEEIRIMLSTFKPFEYIFGRGFGGYYEDYTEFYAFVLNPQLKKFISQSPHVGIFDPMLKGGLILFLFYNFLFLIPILKFKFDKNNSYKSAAFVIVLMSYIFLFIEGFHSYTSSSFQIIIFSISLGYLYNLKKC